MSWLKGKKETALQGRKMKSGRRLGLMAGLLVVIALLVAACGSAAEPAALPAAEPTPLPMAEPTPLPAPTDTPVTEATITPSVTVTDQGIIDGVVTVPVVVSDGPGWLVIHAQADGKPGPILGYSPVADGANSNVAVQLNLNGATSTLYAMLHSDAGQVGTWEFPDGPDAPVMVGEKIVTPAFNVTAGLVASGEAEVEAGEAEVEIEDFQFRPKVLTIKAGTTVKFTNKDDVEHTATSDTNLWDSGYLAKGESFSFTFTEPGTYPYYCIPHGGPGGQGMAATIIVQP